MDDKPKFHHDCDNCEFLGHYQGHDVYYCQGLDYPKHEDRERGPFASLLARFGNEGEEYCSTWVKLFIRQVEGNRLIEVSPTVKLPYQEYLLGGEALEYEKAWMLAILIHWGKDRKL